MDELVRIFLLFVRNLAGWICCMCLHPQTEIMYEESLIKGGKLRMDPNHD